MPVIERHEQVLILIVQPDIQLLESQRDHLRYVAVCEVLRHINSELSVLDDRFEQERLECKARGFEYRKPPPRAEFDIVGQYHAMGLRSTLTCSLTWSLLPMSITRKRGFTSCSYIKTGWRSTLTSTNSRLWSIQFKSRMRVPVPIWIQR